MLVCTLAKRKWNYNISIVTLSRQNEGIFKIIIICFHLLGMNPKTDKVAICRKVSIALSPSHISLNKNIVVVTGVNLTTEVENPYHG